MDFLHDILRSPEVCGMNRLSSRANLFPFPDGESARKFRKQASPFVLDLDGTWRFRYLTDPEKLTAEDFQPDASLTGFEETAVPDCWVMRGHGGPHYTNVNMPFPELPPELPSENPSGLYRRDLVVPADWQGRRMILHFDGAESCFFAFLNGKFIGMSKDSRGTSEFDVTEIARPGKNHLAVLVTKWCDGTYLEDQDMWYLPGLSRSVCLYSTSPNYIADVFAKSTLDADCRTGRLSVELYAGLAPEGPKTLAQHNGYKYKEITGWSFRLRLYDKTGTPVWDAPQTVPITHDWNNPEVDTRRLTAKFSAELPEVDKWSAETPDLYILTVELVSPEGSVSEATGLRIGFRRYETRKREFLVNGQPVLIFGANRHEHHDTRGKAVPFETARRDVELLKQYNFNAVRTCHYPSAPEFYDLCDEYGLYVIDETNLETHAFYFEIANDPRWAPPFLDRAVRNFERDKNHACVYAWSLGNESGCGAQHAAMAGYLRYRDDSRLIHYQGALVTTEAKYMAVNDFVCPMYSSVEHVRDYFKEHPEDDRPFILCEFSHAMGNSNGSLKDYFELFRHSHGIQGGFIWEWLDHGIVKYDGKGRKYWAYGGDFGDVPNDANFVIDGLVWPDRTPHPAMEECKYLAQPAEFAWSETSTGRIRITNRQYFRNLEADFNLRWILEADGVPAESGELDLPEIPPQATAEVTIGYEIPAVPAGTRIELKLELCYRHDTIFAKAGFPAGWEALDVPPSRILPDAVREIAEVKSEIRSDLVKVSCGETTAEITSSGLLNFRFGGKDLVEQGPRATIWRAALDNDGIKLMPERPRTLTAWLAKGYHKVRRRTDQFGGTGCTAELHQMLESPELESNMEFQQNIRMLPDGKLEIENIFMVPESWEDLPRLGLDMEIPLEFNRITYWGNGPFENYIDRDAAARFGRYETTPEEMYTPYIMPQSCGNRTGVVRAEFSSGKCGLRILAPGGMEFAAMRYSEDQLFQAAHTCDLEPADRIFVRLDLRQRGVGTGTCGPDARPEYRIQPGRRSFTVYLEGFDL